MSLFGVSFSSFDSSPILGKETLNHQKEKENTIRKKFKAQFPNLSEENLDFMVKSFSNKEKFLQNIFSLDWTYKLDVHMFNEKLNIKKDEEEFEYLDKEMIQEVEKFEKSKQVPIKLIITEIDLDPSLRKVFSNLLFAMGSSPTFGIFHTAISLGPWIIEWNNSSLCIPKICVSNRSLLSLDIGYTIQTTKQAIEVYDKISNVILEWNTEYTYSQKSPKNYKESKQGNCHDFILAILESLEISVKFPLIIENYLNKMKSDGNSEIFFETKDNKIRNKMNLSSKHKNTFKTHQELDLFVHKMLKELEFGSISEMEKVYPGEVALLKGFDRAFWLRYFSQLERLKKDSKYIVDEKYSPLKDEKSFCCPFDDPRLTFSLMDKN